MRTLLLQLVIPLLNLQIGCRCGSVVVEVARRLVAERAAIEGLGDGCELLLPLPLPTNVSAAGAGRGTGWTLGTPQLG